MKELVEEIARSPGCRVLPPSGQPRVRDHEALPLDVIAFYAQCGGAALFEGADHEVTIVSPDGFVRANPLILGRDAPDDITDSWYVVATGGSGEHLTVDCHPERSGRCHDSFWDSHGVAGSCPIVAMSLTELLRRLLDAKGGRWPWLDGPSEYGDAYMPRTGR